MMVMYLDANGAAILSSIILVTKCTSPPSVNSSFSRPLQSYSICCEYRGIQMDSGENTVGAVMSFAMIASFLSK